MTRTMYKYRADQELPVMQLSWLDPDGVPLEFASGWVATVKVATSAAPTTIILTKTAGITLADTSPNYQIEWTAADFTTITTATGALPNHGVTLLVYAYARRNADSKDDLFDPSDPPQIKLYPAPA